MTSAPVTEQKWDSILNPTQATVNISLQVQEFGALHRLMTRQRQFFALVGSAQDFLTSLQPEEVSSIFGSISSAAGLSGGGLV